MASNAGVFASSSVLFRKKVTCRPGVFQPFRRKNAYLLKERVCLLDCHHFLEQSRQQQTVAKIVSFGLYIFPHHGRIGQQLHIGTSVLDSGVDTTY